MSSILEKLTTARRHGSGIPLTSGETDAVLRAIEVLRRVGDGDCTNPQQEADDILQQIDGRSE